MAHSMSRGAVIGLTVALLVALLWAGRQLDLALTFQKAVRDSPRHGTDVSYRGTVMKWETYIVDHVLPEQASALTVWLIRESRESLWRWYYSVAGMAGAIAGLWIALRRPRRQEVAAVLITILVGGFAGFIVCLMLRMPGGLGFFHVKEIPGASLETHDSFLVLAVVAGLFSRDFYEALRRWLQRWGVPGEDHADHED